MMIRNSSVCTSWTAKPNKFRKILHQQATDRIFWNWSTPCDHFHPLETEMRKGGISLEETEYKQTTSIYFVISG